VRGYLAIEPITTAFGEPDFMFKRLKPVAGDPELRPFELFVLAKIFGGDWELNMRLLSEVRRDYENVFPPIRDQLYRMMVQDGLFPASPGVVRKGWMIAGGLTAASTQDNGADADALRAALEARRAELASCVDHLPLGVKVEYAPGAAPVVTLRGALQGKPEEGCVRAVLKDLKSMSFKSAGTVIHVVK